MNNTERPQRLRMESKKDYDRRQLKNIRVHLEQLLTDEQRARFGISLTLHEPHFQVFRALCALHDAEESLLFAWGGTVRLKKELSECNK